MGGHEAVEAVLDVEPHVLGDVDVGELDEPEHVVIPPAQLFPRPSSIIRSILIAEL